MENNEVQVTIESLSERERNTFNWSFKIMWGVAVALLVLLFFGIGLVIYLAET